MPALLASPQDPRKYPCARWGLGPNASGVWGTFLSLTLDRLITSGPETRESALENLGTVAPSSFVLEFELAWELPGRAVKTQIAGPHSQSL